MFARRTAAHTQRLLLGALLAYALSACGVAALMPVPAAAPVPTTSPAGAMVTPQSTPSPAATKPGVPAPTVATTQSAAQPPAATAPILPANLAGVEWTALPTTRRVVALTFDGGAMAQGVPSILATLARKGVPGTFFLTGRWVSTYPDLARRISAVPGNAIGNHTWDHASLVGLTDVQVQAEIADGERAIRTTTGRPLRPLFRCPYGASDGRVTAIANSMGYGNIGWTVDSLGWEGTARGQSGDTVFSRVVGAARPGEIVLMHVGAAPDGSTLDADALGRTIDELRRRGYGFVALTDFV